MLESTFSTVPFWSLSRSTRQRTPTILQMEAAECGAASLAMILAYYGRWVPLDKMRQDCGVSRDGSKASYMVKAARRYGLQAEGLRVDPQSIKRLPFPLIAFWNLNHFVVVEGYKRKNWYLNDPAEGPRTITEEEFDRGLSGVALTFSKGPDFKAGGERHGLIRSLKQRASGMGPGLVYALSAGVILTLIGVTIPSFTKIYVDHYLIDRDVHWLKTLLWIMLLTLVLQVVVTWLQQSILLRLNFKLALSSAAKFFDHLLRLPVSFFAQRFSGEVQSRVALNDAVASVLSGPLSVTLLHCLTAFFFIYVMLHYSVLLTLVGVLGVGVDLFALSLVSRKRRDINKRVLQERGKLTGVTMSTLCMIETLKSTGSEDDFFARWSAYQAKVTNATQDLGLWTAVLDRVPQLLTSLSGLTVIGLGGLLVMQGALTIGDLIAFQALLIGFTLPINSLVQLGSQLQEVDANLARLDDVLANPIDEELARTECLIPNQSSPPKLDGKVELRSVSFAFGIYDKPFIRNFSVNIQPGNRIALVGSSGSGKSTIGNLIAGLFPPTDGEVLFDGRPRSEIPRVVMCNSLAKVDQSIFLFEGTVRDNIALWNDDITDTAIIQAAKDAAIHEEISARPMAYQEPVLEGGRNFSGGQRQRLEIARALAMDPTILILDEATSSLDPLTEKSIHDNLRRRGCTCIVIAHRLSTIRDCDEIIVLRHGEVAERGAHDELMARDGQYAKLVKEG